MQYMEPRDLGFVVTSISTENPQGNASECASQLEEMSINENNVEADNGNGEADGDDVVTPWNVASLSDSGIDYDKLISKHPFKYQMSFI